MIFNDLLVKDRGLLKGPFGGDIKKAYFVEKSANTYKVYEQGVVNNNDINFGTYYIDEDRFKHLERFSIKTGDILITGAGTLGELFEVPEDHEEGVINQALIRLRINKDIVDNSFFKYYFKWYIKGVAVRYNNHSVIPNLPPVEVFKNIEVSIPDLPTQKKIADVLSCIDDKIALNNKTNTELENLAKTIYDYWFTQFDFPDKNGHPYKSSGGLMVYNETLKREIPAGWKAGCFGDLIEIGNGKDHIKLDDGDFPVYGSGGLMRKVNKSLYSGESVLFPRKGTLNNVMYVNETFWTVDTMFYSIPKKQSLALYVYYNAKHFDFEKMNTGTGVPSMTSSIIKELPIIIPDTSILDSFDKTIQPIYQQVFSNRKENEELTKLRDYLLPLLMNGQIEVK